MPGALMLAVVLGAAVAGWAFMFLPDENGIWSRTWFVAVGLSTLALAGISVDGRLRTVLGPIEPVEVAIGFAVGGVWLVATHIGHAALCRLFPSFIDRVNDLYSLRDRTNIAPVVGPLVAMGCTEELVFRGYVQGRLGVMIAVVAYAGVQVVVRNWALVLAGILCGAVWGTLAWWREGLISAVIAHLIWTGALAFIWPLRGCLGKMGPAETDTLEAIAQKNPTP